MYDRMVREHGYSIRKLADKLGKDKGYLENRLRLADAPPEIRELVSLRKDTLSHAYELMKVDDPKKRRRLAAQVARGELTLIKLRDKIEGRRPRPPGEAVDDDVADGRDADVEPRSDAVDAPSRRPGRGLAPAAPAALIATTRWSTPSSSLADAVEELVDVLRKPGRRGSRSRHTDRANLAKYLTIAKLKLENAIAIVRSDDARLADGSGLGAVTDAGQPAGAPGRRPRRPGAPRRVRARRDAPRSADATAPATSEQRRPRRPQGADRRRARARRRAARADGDGQRRAATATA